MTELRVSVSDRSTADIPAATALDVAVHEDFQSIDALREEWDRFVEDTCGDIFQTFDWCRVWWKHYGGKRRLRVLIFRQRGEIVAIVPLFLDTLWLGLLRVTTARLVGSDFGLVQYSPAVRKEHLGAVARGLAEQLKLMKVDLAQLGPIAGIYASFDELRRALADSAGAYDVQVKDSGVQTYFELDGDLNAYLSSLSKKEREHIRRGYRSVASIPGAGDLPVACEVVPESDLDSSFREFVDLHQSYWQSTGRAGHFGDWPGSAEFHREMAQVQHKAGRLRLMKISAGAAVLGYEYAYKCGNTYFGLLVARRQFAECEGGSLGRVIFCEQVKLALRDGVRRLDSMRGRYEHKLKLGGKLHPIRSILLIPRSTFSAGKARLYVALSKGINLLYYRLWYCRVLHRLKVKERSLWRTWIRTRL